MDDVVLRFCEDIYPSVSVQVVDGSLTSAHAVSVARSFVQEYFPGAMCALIYGSAANGRFGPYSDIDIMILLPQVAFAETRRIVYQDIPIELHLFDKSSFARALEAAAVSGNYNQALSLADASPLIDQDGMCDRLTGAARRVIDRGPPAVPEHMRSAACCSVTSFIIELGTNTNRSERFSIAASLQPLLMASYLGARRRWVNSRKWGVRADPDFADALTHAIEAAYQDRDIAELIALATSALEPWGGLRWIGTGARLWHSRSNP